MTLLWQLYKNKNHTFNGHCSLNNQKNIDEF